MERCDGKFGDSPCQTSSVGLWLVTWTFPGLTALALTQFIPIPIVHLLFPWFKFCHGALFWIAEFLPSQHLSVGASYSICLCYISTHSPPLHSPHLLPTNTHFPVWHLSSQMFLLFWHTAAGCQVSVWVLGLQCKSAWIIVQLFCQCFALSRLVLSKVIFEFSNNLYPKLVLLSLRWAAQSVYGNRIPLLASHVLYLNCCVIATSLRLWQFVCRCCSFLKDLLLRISAALKLLMKLYSVCFFNLQISSPMFLTILLSVQPVKGFLYIKSSPSDLSYAV